jgi:hypothetical protein
MMNFKIFSVNSLSQLNLTGLILSIRLMNLGKIILKFHAKRSNIKLIACLVAITLVSSTLS